MSAIQSAAVWLPGHPLPVAAGVVLAAAVLLFRIFAQLAASAESHRAPLGYRPDRPELAVLIAADRANRAWLRDPDAPPPVDPEVAADATAVLDGVLVEPVPHVGWDKHLPELDALVVEYRARHSTAGATGVVDASGWGFSREPQDEVMLGGPVPPMVEGWPDGAGRTGELIQVHLAAGGPA